MTEHTEHLVRITTKSGEVINMHRDGTDIRICHEDHCVVLPELSGMRTLGLYALLEPLGEKIEFPGEDEDDQTERG